MGRRVALHLPIDHNTICQQFPVADIERVRDAILRVI